jgi:hypothetical protein
MGTVYSFRVVFQVPTKTRVVGASGNSHTRTYIYLDACMREHKPRIKGCGQVNIFMLAVRRPVSSQFLPKTKMSAINLYLVDDAPSKGQGQLQD